MGSNLSPHLCTEHYALWPSPAHMTHSAGNLLNLNADSLPWTDLFLCMIKYPLDSLDKFRSEKRRRISFLITSSSAWQIELSTCPSPGLLNLAKIPICFFCGTGEGADSSSHRIRKSWTKFLAIKNKEPQFWIRVKAFHCSSVLFCWGVGAGCGTRVDEQMTAQISAHLEETLAL